MRGSYMKRLTVTLDEENAEYIDEQSGDRGDFESGSAVINEAVRRMRTGDENGVGAYEPIDEAHRKLREERDDVQGERERVSVLSKLKPW